MTQNGLINGLRNKNDGKSFFGISNPKDNSSCIQYNDYIISSLYSTQFNMSISKNITGRVFDISFCKHRNCYILTMINNALLLYYYIEHSFYFEKDKDYFIILGKVLLTIVIRTADDGQKALLIRVEFNDSEKTFDYVYYKEDTPISIGRKRCVLTIEHCSLSKNHGMIKYSEELQQYYYTDNQSTNGSIFVFQERDSLCIKGDMKFKLNDITFQILELP